MAVVLHEAAVHFLLHCLLTVAPFTLLFECRDPAPIFRGDDRWNFTPALIRPCRYYQRRSTGEQNQCERISRLAYRGRQSDSLLTTQVLHSTTYREMSTLQDQTTVSVTVFGNLQGKNTAAICGEVSVLLSVLPSLCHISTQKQVFVLL